MDIETIASRVRDLKAAITAAADYASLLPGDVPNSETLQGLLFIAKRDADAIVSLIEQVIERPS